MSRNALIRIRRTGCASAIAAGIGVLLLGGCGIKGPLKLPPPAAPATATPAPAPAGAPPAATTTTPAPQDTERKP
jgi:diaminopimelate decarboxylase